MSADPSSPIVIVGMACRVPGADDVNAFADLLFNAETGYQELPSDRCDRALYFDAQKGKTGKTYTTLGGIVPERPLDRELCPLSPQRERLFDVAHLQFAEVAATAWQKARLIPNDRRMKCTGIFVGHSGGTRSGGGLSLGTQIEEALSFVSEIAVFRQLSAEVRREVVSEVIHAIRRDRPARRTGAVPMFHAYQAAALSAQILGLTGPRSVIDAACASSLVALSHAILAIRAGRIDSAMVGGATYNNVDNLILFSHSQACTATDSRPFDDRASGLVSSEGYVAIVITTQEQALQQDLPILGVIRGVGMSSDGKGRSLWAPRMEGQVLALQRAYSDTPLLDIDYMEAHATSTQLGDATELETLRQLASSSPDFMKNRGPQDRLLLGSVKSNIGHTLEAAGLIGLVKILIAMQRGQIPPSLRYGQPNRNFEWATGPVRIVSQTEPWPERSSLVRPRRAAVSAFGIGGLNAHVVVEEPGRLREESGKPKADSRRVPDKPLSAFGLPLSSEPIAIVGRGIVVGGAKSLTEFRELLNSSRTSIGEVSSDRWRNRTGVSDSDVPQTWHSPHCVGGFITDFSFDGARYRIPPKQVQQANPVQMMLIDAVAQALEDVNNLPGNAESGMSEVGRLGKTNVFPMDRQRVGVVIGAIFGGEFGDQLQVGMRLPEICRQMDSSMQSRGVSAELARQVSDEFRTIVLKHRPALLDETGSFTASTLASRVAKTFDLMGGACALDSDDTSGLSALSVATDQLRAGLNDMIICGTAQRSMSLAAFESLDINNRLVRTGQAKDVPDDCSRIIPGEGVVVLMLCRLSDAQRLALPIHGILNDVVQMNETGGQASATVQNDATIVPGRSTEVLTSADAAIVRKIGYLCGAHSLVRIVAETLRPDDHIEPVTIAARTSDRIVLQTQLLNPYPRPAKIPAVSEKTSSPLKSLVSPIMTTANASSDRSLVCCRFAASSGDLLIRLLKDSIGRSDQLFASHRIQRADSRTASSAFQFTKEDTFRSTILAVSPEQLCERITLAIRSAEAGKFRALMDRDRVILWQTQAEVARVAWLFPGQGSHYSETPSVFSASAVGRRTLAAVDEFFAASSLPRLSTVFGNASIKPGEDVWWAQAWVLGVSAALIETLRSQGLRPDAVLGHSFGEFTASLASQVTTLSQTIELARHRANAVMSHMRTAGGLLSVRAALHEVDWILKSAALPVYVTHLNSPRQTVIAGGRDEIVAARALLNQQGLAVMSIQVPAPFHTPLLATAEVAFERMSAGVSMRPPVCGFLSATTVQYLAEPSGIRNSLVRQLTQPVMYMPSIQRMVGDGFRVLLEVGPNDVLTRMNRDIVDSQAICLSLDVPGQPFEERLLLVHAVLECVADVHAPRHSSSPFSVPGSESLERISSSVPADAVPTMIDVTRARRTPLKQVRPSMESAAQLAAVEAEANRGLAPTMDFRISNARFPADAAERWAVNGTRLPISAGDAADRHSASRNLPQPLMSSATVPAVSDAQLRDFTRDLVVELTGYAPDVVDFAADLEADLGIDSIKKAQILGELGEWLGLTVRPESLRLDSVRTLEDAVRVAQSLATQDGAGPEEEVRIPFSLELSGITAPDPPREGRIENGEEEQRGKLPPNDRLDALLIEYVVDQTGYSRDIVDVDADLEADLGLDSIKLAQLIGEMREQFNLESLTLDSIGQARFRTLRGIRDFLVSHAAGPPTDKVAQSEFTPERNQASRAASAPDSLAGDHVRGLALPGLSLSLGSVVRGADPAREASSEWFRSANRELQSLEAATESGILQGKMYQAEIRAMLRLLVHQPVAPAAVRDWTDLESAHWKGVAAGAGVAESSVRMAGAVVRDRLPYASPEPVPSELDSTSEAVRSHVLADSAIKPQTQRYALRVVPAPRRDGMPLNPELHGAALILGANLFAESLAGRIRQLGQTAIILSTAAPVAEIEAQLNDVWQRTATPHLFLAMALDAESMKSLTEAEWKQRRLSALEAPFRICQLWMQRTIDAGLMEDASVVAVTQLGGDFGFSGRSVQSIEAIGGLVKAMLIEAWMRGFRTTPMKVIDMESGLSLQEMTSGVLQELAVPSYDMEIAFRGARDSVKSGSQESGAGNNGVSNGGRASSRPPRPLPAREPERCCVQAMSAPLEVESSARGASSGRLAKRLTRGGTWIVSGGGRGITAVIAMTLAKKYDLKLHLLGTAPIPQLSNEFVRSATQDRSGVRRSIMQDASTRGESPVEAWRNTEKAIEIDATLRDCRKQGISATYYCCDVADFADVAKTIRLVRDKAGPIHGVIHGAGAGQDARFDRKRPDKVEKCLRAKIDGSLALMQATNADPLEWFVTFGSISGRFGANGHTDYSLANDMMAKIVDRYRSQRPEVHSLTFHWHAWGDIGMATKPEARLALEMIDMEFMPARDGIAHFIRELEFGGDEPEVLITDESYFRKFFPAERLSQTVTESGSIHFPLIASAVTQRAEGVCSSVVTLNPMSDRFLSQHRVQGRPTLPFVVSLELMAEAVRARTGMSHPGRCTQARALQAIRFSADDPLAVTVETRPTDDGLMECRLLADVRRRDGRMVEEDREYFRSVFHPGVESVPTGKRTPGFALPENAVWRRVEYGTPEGLIYHGPELQELREVFDDGQTIFGRIAASAPVQLFGGSRARGFTVPCSTMDACLYAVGYAAWHRHQKPSLPVRFDQIEFGRLPDPGEPCLIRITQTNLSDTGAAWDFQLQGHNGDRLLTVTGYWIGWLKAGN